MPLGTGCTRLAYPDGSEVPVQIEGDHTVALITIPAHSLLVLERTGTAVPAIKQNQSLLVLENGLVRYTFNKSGEITEAIDKITGRPIIAPGGKGNVLSLYEDRPTRWDAWEIDFFYTEQFIENADSTGINCARPGLYARGSVSTCPSANLPWCRRSISLKARCGSIL